MPSSPELLSALRRAETLRRGRGRFRGLGIFGSVGVAGALFMTLVTALLAGFGWALGVGSVLGAPLLLAMVAGFALASSRTAEIAKALDAAWLAAGTEVARAGRARTPADLARALNIDMARAEQLHARLAVEAIAGDTDLARDLDPTRVRIVTHEDARGHVDTTLPTDPRFEALEAHAEQAADAEAEAERAFEPANKQRS